MPESERPPHEAGQPSCDLEDIVAETRARYKRDHRAEADAKRGLAAEERVAGRTEEAHEYDKLALIAESRAEREEGEKELEETWLQGGWKDVVRWLPHTQLQAEDKALKQQVEDMNERFHDDDDVSLEEDLQWAKSRFRQMTVRQLRKRADDLAALGQRLVTAERRDELEKVVRECIRNAEEKEYGRLADIARVARTWWEREFQKPLDKNGPET